MVTERTLIIIIIISLLPPPLSLSLSSEVKGVHPDKSYTYKLGICVEADPDIKPDCGIVQYETKTLANGTVLPPKVYCIGKITRAQVTESEWAVYSLWSRVCVCVWVLHALSCA